MDSEGRRRKPSGRAVPWVLAAIAIGFASMGRDGCQERSGGGGDYIDIEGIAQEHEPTYRYCSSASLR
jgi:hypothetical protein